MSAVVTAEESVEPSRLRRVFAARELAEYPGTPARMWYLAVTVVCTMTLYYELYVQGAVSTLLLARLNMSFGFFVYTTAAGSLLGAFGSLIAGVADRVGRTRLVSGGLIVSGVLTVAVIPASTGKWEFTIFSFVVSMIEGMALVATPALMRDFSPQAGRGSAMGFWTAGPVVGSLVVAAVGSLTIGAHPSPSFWTHEYRICGVAGLIVAVLAVVALRELAPALRDQEMVSERDRALLEARAKGIDIEAALKHPWRQLAKADILVPAIGSALFLLFYYTSVAFGQVYFSAVFGFSVQDANGIGNWQWGLNVIALLLFGWISDKLRVRKPLIVIGGVATAALTVVFLMQSGSSAHNATIGYYRVALLVAALSFVSGIAYVPWMAAFTETIEHRNPALTATGLAIWGWILRTAVFVSFAVLPSVVTTIDPIVDYGPTVSQYVAGAPRYHTPAQYPVLGWAESHPTIVAAAESIPPSVLSAAEQIPAPVQATASKYAAQLADAARFAPELAVIEAHPALFGQLAGYSNPSSIPAPLLAQAVAAAGGGATGASVLSTIAANQGAIQAVIAVAPALTAVEPYAAQLGQVAPYAAKLDQIAPYATQLAALSKVPSSVTAYLTAHGQAVASAAAGTSSQWKTWYWLCFAGVVLFVFSVPLLKGRWSPRAAKADAVAHAAIVEQQIARLQTSD